MLTSLTVRTKLLAGFFLVDLIWLISVAIQYWFSGEVELATAIPAILALVATLVVSFLVSTRISRELQALSHLAQTVAQGDLTQTFPGIGQDELSTLAGSFNQMVQDLKTLVHEVKLTSLSIADSSRQLFAFAAQINSEAQAFEDQVDDIAGGAILQKDLIAVTTKEIKGVNTSAEAIDSETRLAAEEFGNMEERATSGLEAAITAATKIESASTQIEQGLSQVQGFVTGIRRIGNLVKIINDIAQQTHILAINATIESRRAGDAGIGFSVIADQIRGLADEVRSFSAQITGLASEIHAETEAVLGTMVASRDGIEETRKAVSTAGKAHEQTSKNVIALKERISKVSRHTQEQRHSTDGMVIAMEEILRVAADNSTEAQSAREHLKSQGKEMETLAGSAQQLTSLAERLEKLVGAFKVEKASN